MQAQKKGKPPGTQRPDRGRQNHHSQMRHLQMQQQFQQEQKQSLFQVDEGHSDEPYKYSFEEMSHSYANPVWDPVDSRHMSSAMSSQDVNRMQGVSAPTAQRDLVWRPKPSQGMGLVAASLSGQTIEQSQNLQKPISEQVQEICPLANQLSHAEAHALQESTQIKQELQEIERQRLSSSRYVQTSSHPPNVSVSAQLHLSPNGEVAPRAPYLTEQQHLLNLQQQFPDTDVYNQRDPHGQQKFQALGMDLHATSTYNSRSNTNTWKVPSNLAFRHTLAGSRQVEEVPVASLCQPFQWNGQKTNHRIPSEDVFEDKNQYVRKASDVADKAKLAHRGVLKEAQRSKEMEAEARGEPLSAKEKERERSRRESAVTRKRAEIYIQELEKTARNVPYLENTIQRLLAECQRLRVMVSPGGHDPVEKHHLSAPMSLFSRSEGTKSEPGMVESPNTSSATRVVGELKELDL